MSNSSNTKLKNNLDVARSFHKNGQLAQAMAIYKKILRLIPTQPDALHYLGLAYYQTGNTDAATVSIQRAIAIAPNYLDAMNNLANIYKETEQFAAAQALYIQVLSLDPEHTNALINMAVILREKKQTKDALNLIHRALALQPQHAIAQHNLGNIYTDLQQFELAETAFRHALDLNPQNHHTAKRLAHVLNKLGRTAEAIPILNAVVMQHPDDAVATHLLAAYAKTDIPARASDLYIKQTFDDYSASFDLALADLQYQLPQLISQRLLSSVMLPLTGIDILDIGCGTGLCAPLIKSVARTLVGVDLSGKMLAKAALLNLYDELHELELCHFMQSSKRQFDCVICADTLVYFGELQPVFSAVFEVLQPGGFFIFSVEQHHHQLQGRHYLLQSNGRYSHPKTYVDKALQAAGFFVCQIDDVAPRLESGKEVDGVLIVAQKKP